jgi:hypothetical protein
MKKTIPPPQEHKTPPQEHYLYEDGNRTSTHRVTVSWSQNSSKRTLEISVSAGNDEQAAILKGTIQGDTAVLEHMAAGKFPAGTGVGYFMVDLFAEQIIKYCNPVPRVRLGTPVDEESIKKAKQKGNEVSGEEKAVHIYQELGFDVSNPQMAVTSEVTASDLHKRSADKVKGWSKLSDVPLH